MPIRFASKPGLVAYITVGDPDLATTHNIAIAAIDAGADVLELGVPFSDPLADGPVIQRASERAVKNGTRLHDVLALAAALRLERPQTGLIIFTYYNPVLRFGLENFCAAAEQAGVDGVLVTDMIVEEAGDYLAALHRHHLAPIFLAAPTSPDARLERICRRVARIRLRHLARRHHRHARLARIRCRTARQTPAPLYQIAHRRRLRHLESRTVRRSW